MVAICQAEHSCATKSLSTWMEVGRGIPSHNHRKGTGELRNSIADIVTLVGACNLPYARGCEGALPEPRVQEGIVSKNNRPVDLSPGAKHPSLLPTSPLLHFTARADLGFGQQPLVTFRRGFSNVVLN